MKSNYVEYSSSDLHSFSGIVRYVCVSLSPDIVRELNKLYIDEIIEVRSFMRKDKKWEQCDIVRDYLDDRNVYLFDTKDFQETYNLNDRYFDNMSKVEKIHNIKFKNRRGFVEWNIKKDIQSEKKFDAWLYTQKNKM